MPISLTSQWFIQPGQEMEARQALMQLALDVQASEPGTLTYLVHTPFGADARLQSLPPPDPLLVLFFETYASPGCVSRPCERAALHRLRRAARPLLRIVERQALYHRAISRHAGRLFRAQP